MYLVQLIYTFPKSLTDLFKCSEEEEEEDPSSSDMEAKELVGKTFEQEISVSSSIRAAAGQLLAGPSDSNR